MSAAAGDRPRASVVRWLLLCLTFLFKSPAATSRHIGASYPGMNYSLPAAGTVVDTLLARTEGYGTLTRCLFSGIIASADAASHAVVWSRTVPQCSVAPRGDDSLPTAVLSDDGKLMTVAVYMDQMTVSVLLLDASNGSTIATYTPSDATTVGRVSAVSPNAKGDIVAITMGEYVHVVNTSAGTLFGGQASPMHMGDGVTTPATLCPMGVFLITAAPSGSGAGAVIHRWCAFAARLCCGRTHLLTRVLECSCDCQGVLASMEHVRACCRLGAGALRNQRERGGHERRRLHC